MNWKLYPPVVTQLLTDYQRFHVASQNSSANVTWRKSKESIRNRRSKSLHSYWLVPFFEPKVNGVVQSDVTLKYIGFWCWFNKIFSTKFILFSVSNENIIQNDVFVYLLEEFHASATMTIDIFRILHYITECYVPIRSEMGVIRRIAALRIIDVKANNINLYQNFLKINYPLSFRNIGLSFFTYKCNSCFFSQVCIFICGLSEKYFDWQVSTPNNQNPARILSFPW